MEISENIRSNSLSVRQNNYARIVLSELNIISIKAQLNSTYITVFTISIYATLVKLYGLEDQGFKPLAGARNFSYPKNVQMGSKSTQPPTGAPSPGIKWLEHKAGHTHHLLQRLRMSGPTVILSHMP